MEYLTVLFVLLVAGLSLGAAGTGEVVLFGFGEGFDVGGVETHDASARLVPQGEGQALRIEFGHAVEWPGIVLKPPGGPLDLSAYRYVKVDVHNRGEREGTCTLRVDNPGADGASHCVQVGLELGPGESGTIVAELSHLGVRFSRPVEIVGMRDCPGGPATFDPADVTQMVVFVPRPMEDHSFVIGDMRAEGSVRTFAPDEFFPFIDGFGQYVHAEWPGKVHSPAELRARAAEEEADLAAHPGPPEWNEYGGWAGGPELEATGAFRTEKVGGRWWLVDPAGGLFWSHGIDCVGSGGAITPVTDRRHYFAALPAEGDPLSACYGRGSWAPHGYYRDRGQYETYNFSAANALRRHGDGWEDASADLVHRRLRSWGMNTIGNWSDRRVTGLGRTPYATDVWFQSPVIEGSEGYWGQFPDPFHPDFAANLGGALRGRHAGQAGDPWCIGFFVHNELGWGDDTSLAVAALQSPAEQPAKVAFVEALTEEYGTVEALNAAWGTAHSSWEALMASREAPAAERAGGDLRAFYSRIAERYFRTCRDEIRQAAPGRLYLGCRFAWVNDAAVRAAAQSCDVVTYNLYRRSVADSRLPAGLDVPVLVGEFHFGALDRGMFHPGLVPCEDQEERAASYQSYVEGALGHPSIVGTHWFQYGSQATTGRGDGENYQIGFVDVCGNPYVETIAAAREVGYSLYETRAGRQGMDDQRARARDARPR
jgi:hypothetical protein